MARKPKTEPAGLTTELVPDKLTPGTVRFTEEKGAPKVLPSIYIPKESLAQLGYKGDEHPKRITVTILVEEE